MGLQQQLAQGLFPVGSARRRKVVEAARSVGIVSKPIPTDYERWVERVEPHLWAEQLDGSANGDVLPHFRIEVACDKSTSAADVTATTISLIDQSYPRWSAVLQFEGCTPEATAAAKRAVEGDKRIRSINSTIVIPLVTDQRMFVLQLEAGSTLAIRGLNELATALGAPYQIGAGDVGFVAVVADADSLVPVTRRREFPLLLPEPHLDLVEQCDVTSACFARQADNDAPLLTFIQAGKVAYSPRVVLHRKRTQPPRAALLASGGGTGVGGGVGGGLGAGGTANAAGPGSGTRVRHLCTAGTTIDLVIRDPFGGRRGTQQQKELHSNAGDRTTIVSTRNWNSSEPFRVGNGGEVTVVVDGSVTPTEINWLDDLVGALLRPHVLAVAPLILAPSGVAFDAGVELTNAGLNSHELDGAGDSLTVSLKARSGRLDFPPYDVARVTPVASLSMRVVIIRSVDAAMLSTFSTRNLYVLAQKTKRTCLVWAHQRWRMDASLEGISPLTPALSAWKEGRLGQWVDPTIEPHHPSMARIGEGVW